MADIRRVHGLGETLDTCLQALQSTTGLTGLDWLGNLSVEGRPVIQRAYTQELDEGEDLLNVVLPGGPCQQEEGRIVYSSLT